MLGPVLPDLPEGLLYISVKAHHPTSEGRCGAFDKYCRADIGKADDGIW